MARLVCSPRGVDSASTTLTTATHSARWYIRDMPQRYMFRESRLAGVVVVEITGPAVAWVALDGQSCVQTFEDWTAHGSWLTAMCVPLPPATGGGHRLLAGACWCGHTTTDDPVRCSLASPLVD